MTLQLGSVVEFEIQAAMIAECGKRVGKIVQVRPGPIYRIQVQSIRESKYYRAWVDPETNKLVCGVKAKGEPKE